MFPFHENIGWLIGIPSRCALIIPTIIAWISKKNNCLFNTWSTFFLFPLLKTPHVLSFPPKKTEQEKQQKNASFGVLWHAGRCRPFAAEGPVIRSDLLQRPLGDKGKRRCKTGVCHNHLKPFKEGCHWTQTSTISPSHWTERCEKSLPPKKKNLTDCEVCHNHLKQP